MSAHSRNRVDAQGRGGKSGKYLAFRCGGESFAAPVAKVREIIGIQQITAVPKTAAHVKGVLNLRGRVIPVIDLRRRLGMDERPYDARTCIVVMQPEAGGGSYYVGVVVDTVSEVVSIFEDDVQPAGDVTLGLIQSPFVAGVARVRDRLKILLNLELALSREDAEAVADQPARAAEERWQDVA